jgi:hypothetical protein
MIFHSGFSRFDAGKVDGLRTPGDIFDVVLLWLLLHINPVAVSLQTTLSS